MGASLRDAVSDAGYGIVMARGWDIRHPSHVGVGAPDTDRPLWLRCVNCGASTPSDKYARPCRGLGENDRRK